MAVATTNDLVGFASRVERLCDFFLNKLSDEKARDGSQDVRIIEDLKQDAADFQFTKLAPVDTSISGLHEYMRGTPVAETKES